MYLNFKHEFLKTIIFFETWTSNAYISANFGFRGLQKVLIDQKFYRVYRYKLNSILTMWDLLSCKPTYEVGKIFCGFLGRGCRKYQDGEKIGPIPLTDMSNILVEVRVREYLYEAYHKRSTSHWHRN